MFAGALPDSDCRNSRNSVWGIDERDFNTRHWLGQTVELDLGPGVTDHVDLVAPRVQGFAELGIPLVSPVRCLNLADQVAQKLHACTGPGSTGRARDILDILLIDALGERVALVGVLLAVAFDAVSKDFVKEDRRGAVGDDGRA